MESVTLILLLFLGIILPGSANAIQKETDGIIMIYPYNPNAMNYENVIPPNESYYLLPDNPMRDLYNPNVRIPPKTSYESPLDALISNKIEHLISADFILIGTDIRVSTLKGIVGLEGTVTNQEQLDEAITTAQSVDGVEDVVSNLTITPP